MLMTHMFLVPNLNLGFRGGDAVITVWGLGCRGLGNGSRILGL